MKLNIYLLSVMGIAAIALSACKKGDIGPQGEQGIQGEKGERGERGTANVIYSSWVSLQQAQRDTTIDGTKMKVNHFPVPRLTQALIDNGSIQVYMRFGSTVLPLPYTSYAGARANTVSFIPKVGIIYVTRYTHDNSALLGFGAIQFRYVLIPGGVSANANLTNVDLRNYEAVRAALHIVD